MASKRKSRMLSLRVTEEQFAYLEEMAKRIRRASGFKITRASIVLKLMELGLPALEREFPKDLDSYKDTKKYSA